MLKIGIVRSDQLCTVTQNHLLQRIVGKGDLFCTALFHFKITGMLQLNFVHLHGSCISLTPLVLWRGCVKFGGGGGGGGGDNH